MDIIVRDGRAERVFDSVIRAGIIGIAQRYAKPGSVVFLPGPGWTPEQGAKALTTVTIKEVGGSPRVATGFDEKGLAWGIWL